MRIPVSRYGVVIRRKISILKVVTVGEINQDSVFVVKDEEPAYIATDQGSTFLITGNCVTFSVTEDMAAALERSDVSEIVLTDQGNVFALTGEGDTLFIVPQVTVISGANQHEKRKEAGAGSRTIAISSITADRLPKTWSYRTVANLGLRWLMVIIATLLLLRY